MQIEVPIQLPSQLEDEIRKTIASVIIEGAKQATSLYYDLPPYANKSQLKAALNVGSEKVKQWEAEGLPLTRFSDNDYRYDRNDIIKFFDNRKI
jgi:hypothetical protein